MQPAPSPVFYEPPLAAKPQLREKPHQGLPSKNPTWNQGPNVCNFTVTLGLRATVVENGVGETYSARYYNPLTGRFMSRDPEDGKLTDPKSLHKYLYADGDPVNVIDPRGQSSTADYVLTAVIVAAVVEAPMHYWWIPDYGCTKMGQSATGVLIASPLFSPAGAMFAWIYGVLVGLNCWNY